MIHGNKQKMNGIRKANTEEADAAAGQQGALYIEQEKKLLVVSHMFLKIAPSDSPRTVPVAPVTEFLSRSSCRSLICWKSGETINILTHSSSWPPEPTGNGPTAGWNNQGTIVNLPLPVLQLFHITKWPFSFIHLIWPILFAGRLRRLSQSMLVRWHMQPTIIESALAHC